MRCVKAGMHIHLDKPAGESLPAVVALHDEAKRQNVTIQMGYMLRYNPAFQALFAAAREGILGEIFEVHAVMSKVIDGKNREKLAEYRGGAMFELGCHVIDQVVTLLGKPEEVTAYGRQVRTETDSQIDNQLAVMKYAKATATVNASMLEVDGGPRRQFVACGTKGTFEIRPLEPPQAQAFFSEAHSPYRKGRQTLDLPKMSGRYDAEFADLAAVIRGEKPFAWSHEHDLAAHEAILRASGLPVG
jgi:predicted dehydrogenase